MKKIICFMLVSILSSCSNVNTNQIKAEDINKQSSINEVKLQQVTKEELTAGQKNVFVAEVSNQKGGSFSVNINLKEKAPYQVKSNNVNGVVGVEDTAYINRVDIYLFRLPSSFVIDGGDPAGSTNENLVTSFTGPGSIVKTDSTFNILFKGIPGNVNKYWVGIILRDSNNNIINKPPTIPWSGGTLAQAPSLALSTSGVAVDPTNLTVNPVQGLIINLGLIDTKGAQISTDVTATPGGPLVNNVIAS